MEQCGGPGEKLNLLIHEPIFYTSDCDIMNIKEPRHNSCLNYSPK